jgi:MFS family permease
MVLIGLMAHLPPMMTDQGYSLQTAAYVLTVYTAVSMVFQIIGGYVGDRVPKHLALTFFTLIQAGSVFILTFGPPTLPVAYGFAVVFGIGFGGRNPLTTSIRGEYFGRKSFGMIMGVSQVPMNVLLLIAPVFAGLMRDWQGDYVVAFNVLGGFSALGGVLFFFARPPKAPSREASVSGQQAPSEGLAGHDAG